MLLPSFGKRGVELNLLKKKVDIEDTEYSSKYFVVTEFNPVLTAGRNSISFNGSTLLKDKSEILVECLDSNGNSLYIEHAKSVESRFTDASKFVISVHVYEETYNGAGKVIIVGTTKRNEIVRWIGNYTIDKTLDNNSNVRFYYKPTLEAVSLLYPVVDTGLAQVSYPPPPTPVAATGTATVTHYVKNILISNRGSGYTNQTSITISGGSTSGDYATATPNINGGEIQSITIVHGGSGYTEDQKGNIIVTIQDSGGGTGAQIREVQLGHSVTSVTIVSSGTGYTSQPTVVFNGGYGASATATITDGAVTSVAVINGGDGYINGAEVIFSSPTSLIASTLNERVSFSSSFYSYAANPVKGTNKNSINFKQTDIDYRLTLSNISDSDLLPNTYPSRSFNSQMEGQTITLHIDKIQLPFSYLEETINATSSYTIKKVLDSKTISINEPFYYYNGKNQIVTNILQGRLFCDYNFIRYNTNPDSSKVLILSPEEQVNVKESYAEITYRNIKTFSGFVSRHKLYRKSSFSPGDFQLISNELLSQTELLIDPITFNRFYDKIGVFYHQPHISKYWWGSDATIELTASSFPINSMRIDMGDPSQIDGTKWVMAKNDSIGTTNDNIYYPYDSTEYSKLSGSSYNSNFINLKKDTTYLLSTDIIIEKSSNDTANVDFYFTSSIESIKLEKTYNSKFGMKLGTISTDDGTSIKYFNEKQYMFFVPSNDYFGTLTIVPYKCNVILSNLSLVVYGDHGFSPDTLVIKIPFDVKIKEESFDIKAELLDRNSNVVYSNLKTIQTFDADGESLYGYQQNPLNTVMYVGSGGSSTTINNLYVSAVPHFPNLQNCDDTIRLVGWRFPNVDETDGKLCYTNVSRLYIDSDDYITVHEWQEGTEHIAKSVAVRYDFSKYEGRKIYVDAAGNKEEFP